MTIFVLTKCITYNAKCDIGECSVHLDGQSAKDAISDGIKRAIQDCVEKYGVNPNNIEPKNDQGARVVQMYDGKYAWKIKKVEIELEQDKPVFILLHAHNRGYVSYAESHVYASREEALSALEKSHETALSMWRLMLGKTQFENVTSNIEDGAARIQLGGEIETWRIEDFVIPVPEVSATT